MKDEHTQFMNEDYKTKLLEELEKNAKGENIKEEKTKDVYDKKPSMLYSNLSCTTFIMDVLKINLTPEQIHITKLYDECQMYAYELETEKYYNGKSTLSKLKFWK